MRPFILLEDGRLIHTVDKKKQYMTYMGDLYVRTDMKLAFNKMGKIKEEFDEAPIKEEDSIFTNSTYIAIMLADDWFVVE